MYLTKAASAFAFVGWSPKHTLLGHGPTTRHDILTHVVFQLETTTKIDPLRVHLFFLRHSLVDWISDSFLLVAAVRGCPLFHPGAKPLSRPSAYALLFPSEIFLLVSSQTVFLLSPPVVQLYPFGASVWCASMKCTSWASNSPTGPSQRTDTLRVPQPYLPAARFRRMQLLLLLR